METQLNLQVNLLERGTYKNLADLKQQITLFAKQMFNNDEEELEDEDLVQNNDMDDEDLAFDEENDPDFEVESDEDLSDDDDL